MSAAAAVAVAVGAARLPVTLVIGAVHLASVLAAVGWHLVRSHRLCAKNIVPVASRVVEFVLEDAIVDAGSDGARAERAFDERAASHGSILAHLAAAGALRKKIHAFLIHKLIINIGAKNLTANLYLRLVLTLF